MDTNFEDPQKSRAMMDRENSRHCGVSLHSHSGKKVKRVRFFYAKKLSP